MNRILKLLLALTLSACATLPGHEPIQVTVADIESMEGEGMEMRMLVKLRVQNPNEAPLEFDGVFIKVEVLDRTLATGVSDQRGTVPASARRSSRCRSPCRPSASRSGLSKS